MKGKKKSTVIMLQELCISINSKQLHSNFQIRHSSYFAFSRSVTYSVMAIIPAPLHFYHF